MLAVLVCIEDIEVGGVNDVVVARWVVDDVLLVVARLVVARLVVVALVVVVLVVAVLVVVVILFLDSDDVLAAGCIVENDARVEEETRIDVVADDVGRKVLDVVAGVSSSSCSSGSSCSAIGGPGNW